MRKVLLICLLFSIAACKSRKVSNASEKFTLENLAEAIEKNNFEKIYSEASITQGSDFFEEGTVERPFTIIFPETSDEALIIWKDENRNSLHQIYVDKNGRWKSNKGIEIGTTYDELVEINEGPIDVYGFGWDYSGAVDWKEGKLADTDIRVFLAPENEPPQKFYGDHVIDSNLVEEIKNLNLRVRAIVLQNPH